ncbi:PREDICTED: protein NRT1/ PTR FAMILY 1.2-like isoform X2 [Populus euphratica]|uniref:Protein NRT1/ PTR FAMILY 1.2-like isoform X2 n=1 Tax=Populus euphratica TaxID=75702 RepID=A0AAJ6UC04_POPEU|nr:PREDICTED: protein NRT1/ PTR FAMILY 1.2-like isoform X2 [Populus euphratica]
MITEPLLSSPKGGIRALFFIIANEALERLASFGLSTNMILYLTREYGMDAASGAQILFLYSAAGNFMPIIGAFLADTYVGRYPMIGFGCIASLLGMVLLWLTTIIPGARVPSCAQFSSNCNNDATTPQLLFLYFCLGLMSIGAGGIRSCSLAFGADQLSKRDSLKHAGILESFFSWYYVTSSASVFISMTCIVYIQDTMGWKVGFGVPVVLMILSTLSFFLASPIYVKPKAKASWLIGFARVLVASYRKRRIELSSLNTDELYHHRKGSALVVPSERIRFLNKACVIKNPGEDLMPDGRASDPWTLCTVDQVEELKALIKVIPIWSTGVLMSINVLQHSFIVLQASTMDRHITSKFQVPAGSFTAFQLFSSVIWIALYDRVVIPLASKIRGKPSRLGLKQRIGIGILSSSAAMAALAIIESVRRKTAIEEGFYDDPNSVLHISALWLLLYFFITGFAEAFCGIGQNEFFYTELPKSMSSVASNLFEMGLSVSNLIASLLVTIVRNFFKGNDQESWLSSNINKGHYDYYYWLLAGLSLANFIYYRACCKAYGPCKGQEGNTTDGGEALTDED